MAESVLHKQWWDFQDDVAQVLLKYPELLAVIPKDRLDMWESGMIDLGEIVPLIIECIFRS